MPLTAQITGERLEMPEKVELNYPDVLGHIAGEARHNAGAVQVAMAVRPQTVQAGHPFEVIMIIQNTADVAADVTVNLQLPERDIDNKKGRFLAKSERLVIGLEPAEVGYVTLPVTTLPDTAVSDSYSVGMDIAVKTLDKKPGRVRAAEGGAPLNPRHLKPDRREQLEALKSLTFSANKRGGWLRGEVLEVKLNVLPGKVGKLVNLKPGWFTLWTLDDYQEDDDALVEKYQEVMRLRVLPALRKEALYPVLLEKTRARFSAAGYELQAIEALLITKVLTLVLEYANAGDTGHAPTIAAAYDFSSRLLPRTEKQRFLQVLETGQEPPPLPNWAKAMLKAIARDERASKAPVKAIAHFAYDDLLRDAVLLAFHAVEIATGEEMGTPEEMDDYALQVLSRLREGGNMDFNHTYLPLVLGGMVLFDQVLLPDDKLPEILHDVRIILDARRAEEDDESQPVFVMTRAVVEHALRKYGYVDR